MQIYMHKLKANGVIVFHLSNRYMNLEPQIAALSRATRVPAITRLSASQPIYEGASTRSATSFYAAMTSNPNILLSLQHGNRWQTAEFKHNFRLWRDDYANILAALGINRGEAN
jgi:hypothetical protein